MPELRISGWGLGQLTAKEGAEAEQFLRDVAAAMCAPRFRQSRARFLVLFIDFEAFFMLSCRVRSVL